MPAKAVHLALYALMIAMPLAGWALLSAEGDAIPFYGLDLPALIRQEPCARRADRMGACMGGDIFFWLILPTPRRRSFHQYWLKDQPALADAACAGIGRAAGCDIGEHGPIIIVQLHTIGYARPLAATPVFVSRAVSPRSEPSHLQDELIPTCHLTTVPAILSDALDAHGYDTLTPVHRRSSPEDAHGPRPDRVRPDRIGQDRRVRPRHGQRPDRRGRRIAPSHTPQTLIVAPTRELALQVSREFIWLYGPAGARIATCVGGMDASKERRALSQGAQIVVGTPGRLRDHLERGALDLSGLKVAVLDEADEMLDMGFREDLEEILDATPDGRRTMLFSATMPQPIVALAKRYQRDAHRSRPSARTAAMATSNISRSPSRLPTSKIRWSTCCVCTKPKPRCCSAPLAITSAISTPA